MFKILVVEDDKELNRTVCSFLNHSGYEAAGGLKWGKVGLGFSRLVDAEILRATVLPILKETPELVIMRRSDNDFIWEP